MSDSDEESYNPNANYLSGNLQALPNTPFAAMIAEQRSNYAIATNQDNRSKDTYGLGAPGKNSIKEVCFFEDFFRRYFGSECRFAGIDTFDKTLSITPLRGEELRIHQKKSKLSNEITLQSFCNGKNMSRKVQV